jgi:lipid-binding SYLF domain-containing protein
MNFHKEERFMHKAFSIASAALFAAFVLIGAARPAAALSQEQEVVDKARVTATKLLSDPNFGSLPGKLKDAKAIIIIPSLIKGAFFIGAQGGTGVLLAKSPQGSWSYPAFFTVGGGSFGLQIGAKAAEVILLIMNEGALEAILKNQVKLGADASFAMGEIGAGVEGSTTTNVNADIIAFGAAEGLFAGVALEGAVINSRDSMDEAYYGKGAFARSIVVDQKFSNGSADPLRQVLAAY